MLAGGRLGGICAATKECAPNGAERYLHEDKLRELAEEFRRRSKAHLHPGAWVWAAEEIERLLGDEIGGEDWMEGDAI